MVKYEKYEKDGKRFYHIKGYLGVDPTGKQININKKGFPTKKEAQLYYSNAKLKLESNSYRKQSVTSTYEEIYNEWIETYEHTVKESTFVKTVQLFQSHILPVFGSYRIDKIEYKLIQETINAWYKQFAQYKKVFNYFNRIMTYAIQHGYIESNPSQRVVIPTKERDYGSKKTTKDYYTKGELKQFMKALDDYGYPLWQCFFHLLAYTGIRRGEALALTWGDINFDDYTLSINKTLTEGKNRRSLIQSPKSKASNRTIILDDSTVKLLKHWKKEQAKLLLGLGFNAMSSNQLLFSKYENNKHMNLSTPRNRLVNICKKYDVPMINIHGFRHTHVSLLGEAGVPIKDIKERLGHSDIKITMNVYTHVTKDSKNESAKLFSKYMQL